MKINRTVYRVGVIAVFVIANLFILRGISSVIAFVKSGADREQMMAKVLKVNDYYKPVFNWVNLDNPGREFIAKNQGEVQRDYSDSWYVKNLSQSVNTKKGIADFFTDSSRVNLFKIIDFNKENNLTVHGTTLNHNIDINFFSADGKLVAFDDKNVHEIYKIYQNDSLITQQDVYSNYKIVMLLEDGFWRIRHMVRNDTTLIDKQRIKTVEENIVQRKGKQLLLNHKPFYIRGINYYPKDTPWEMYGDKFNDTIIAQDFRLLDSLGFNTARVFVNFNDFGKEEVDAKMVNQLKQTLDLAQQNNLKLVVTLFDFFGNYDIINWTLTEQHLKGVVAPFKEHPAILAWDIKNEADLDMQVHSEEQLTSWLNFAIQRLQFYDPNHLSTIGWLHPHPHFAESSTTDVFTFHFYEDVNRFNRTYEKWSSFSDKPVVVGEFGLHSYKKLIFGNSEEEQLEHYKTILDKIDAGEKHFIAWTLYDFPELPKKVFGVLPWKTLPQKNMGLFTTEGKPKLVLKAFEAIGMRPNQEFNSVENSYNLNNSEKKNEKVVKSDGINLSDDKLKKSEVEKQLADNQKAEVNESTTKITSSIVHEKQNINVVNTTDKSIDTAKPKKLSWFEDKWDSGYYLVIGVFKEQANAKNEQQRLQHHNLQVSCYFDKPKGLFYLVDGPYSNNSLIIPAKEKIKQAGLDSWLLRK
ncbi:hypothetical protein GCM10011414_21450 [Croceivirga lutea]|uniref:SPOR domain-containing protein n=1 Tax=Croceivirga lutea TaxID=1775167 RepID=UPI00163A13D6|nr:SPOR domain-containing protein [Croceivirga lutea]GGG51565.1 hypothetical protein GCM10011414_21450 [Croceivirga lutea]